MDSVFRRDLWDLLRGCDLDLEVLGPGDRPGGEAGLHWLKIRWCLEHPSICRSGSPGSQAHRIFLMVFLSKTRKRAPLLASVHLPRSQE